MATEDTEYLDVEHFETFPHHLCDAGYEQRIRDRYAGLKFVVEADSDIAVVECEWCLPWETIDHGSDIQAEFPVDHIETGDIETVVSNFWSDR